MKHVVLTLVLIRRGDEILLGLKKTGFGAGVWNGPGGKVEAGESIESGARREVREEMGIDVGELKKVGIVTCEYRDIEDEKDMEVHIFETQEYFGEPIETEEMRPRWFQVSKYPFDKAWPDDQFWFPEYLKGKPFKGRFRFHGLQKIVEHEIGEVPLGTL
jgi:8-oxo-dGTP diphosphatase/2-hydroxy-dATP diphosphatase